MKKRFIAMGMVIAMLLTGCAQNAADNQTETPQAQEAPQQEAKADDAASSDGEVITLTWLNHYAEAGKQAWVQSVKEQFEAKYDNVVLNIETVDADSHKTILQTKLASDDAPTIFDLSSNADLRIYNEAGYLADLSDFECLQNVDAGLLKEGQVDGKQVGIPVELSGYGVFYNVDIFNKLGLEEPTTLSELKNVCETLKANGITPFATPFGESWAFSCYPRVLYDAVCWNNDGQFWAKLADRSLKFADSEDFKKQMQTVWDFHEYWGDDAFGTSWDSAQQIMANGEAAMIAHGSWAVDGITSYNPDINIGVFPMPVSEDPADRRMIKEPGQQLVLFNYQDEKVMEAARNLYNMIYSQDCMRVYAEEAHQMPSVPGDYNILPALAEIVNYPAEESFSEAGLPRNDPEHEDVLFETMLNAYTGSDFDVEELAAQLDAGFDNIKK
ncbi:MAG: extracellular solute-binding protein [Lachnospiraceae bacterium]|nr:extracellular solute-binding protein [Lachnospiraceae bacterium]